MKLNFLKIFFRNLKKNKLISVINILGLTIGILSSLFILEYVYYERSFDSYHKNGSRVCRVVYDRYQYGKLQYKTANSFYPTGRWLKENYSQVQDWAVLVRKYNITISYENTVGSKIFYNESKTYYASNSLLQMFTIPLVEGGVTCLKQPNTVAVSKRAAERYFGSENPLGKVLTVDNTEKYTVTAVYQNIPANSHLQTDFLFSLPTYINPRSYANNDWGNDLYHSYLLLAPGVDPATFCKRALPDMIAKNYQTYLTSTESRDEFHLQPIPDIHLKSNIEWETEPPGNQKTTNILFGFAIFLLIVAWINYINLVTALSLERAREIGIKKINGATKISLIGQFMSEAFIFNLGCLAITLILFSLINPSFKSITNIRDFNLFLEPGFIRTGLLVFLSGIAASSIYPALVISSFKPIAVLKGKFKNSVRGMMFRKGLVTVQFIISIALLIGTLVTFKQASFLMKKDMGVDYNSTLVIRAPKIGDNIETRMDKLMLFKNRVSELSEVQGFTVTSDIPGDEIANFFGGRRKGFDNNDTKYYYHIAVDDQYIDYFKVKVLFGRKFHPNETYAQHTILMNKLAADRFGYSNPEDAVGKILMNGADTEWLVIGVVDDFNYRSIKLEPMPTIITLSDDPKIFMAIRLRSTHAGSYASLVTKMKLYYETIYPGQPFEYFSLDDKMALDLKPDKTFASIFTLFSILAILVAIIGIIGLILITINQNMRELGIRKALGAEVSDVTSLLSKQLLFQFIIAILTAIPISYYGYKHWFLETYIHRIDLEVWFFAFPVILMSIVIFSIILMLSVKVFRMKLAEVLQNE